MALVAPMVDGVLQTTTTSSDSLTGTKNKNEVDSDMFLTLLMAEMQNQDPLEPTSNTEWVSQYATFTQVEQMDELTQSMDLVRANSLINKEVIMKVTSVATGDTSYIRGMVDYVLIENGKPLLVIDENKYSIDDLDTVASDNYFDAYDKYYEFAGMMSALPDEASITTTYENAMKEVYELYSNMTEYELSYTNKFASEEVSKYEACIKKLEGLGVTFGEEEVEEITLEDAVDNFNEKMEELLAQMSKLNTSVNVISAGTSTSETGQEEELTEEELAQLTEEIPETETTEETVV